MYFEFWPYILILIIITFASFGKPKYRSRLIFIAMLLFSGLRFDVGWDYTGYVGIIESGVESIGNSRIEPLSKIILQIGAYLGFYPLVFFIYAFFTLYFVHRMIIKYSFNRPLSWLVFYCMPMFFLASLSTIRQSLSMAIVLFSFNYIHEKKFFHYIIVILIATLLHYSSVFGLFLLLIYQRPFTRTTNVVVILCSFFISDYLYNIVDIFMTNDYAYTSRYAKFYLNGDHHASTKLQYIYYTLVILNIVLYDRLVVSNPKNKVFIAITTFGMFLYNVLSFEPVTASRISAFFMVFWIFLIPDYLRLLEYRARMISNVVIHIFFIVMLFIYLNIYVSAFESGVNEKNSFVPYKSWMFNF